MRRFYPIQPPVLQRRFSESSPYQYREYMPGKGLESYVACYWTLHTCAANYNALHRIIPDGCVDIIMDLQATSTSKGAFVVGIMTNYETMTLSAPTSMFGIRFYSDKVSRLLRYPVSELTGNPVLLTDLWGRKGEIFVDEVHSSEGISEIIEQVESILQTWLLNLDDSSHSLLPTFMQYIYANRGSTTVQALADQHCYSERTVRRIFQEGLGISPKEMLDIIRFQYLLREWYGGNRIPFSEMALSYGYYDQPHFIRQFKRFYGMTPGEVLV
ncbi:helix-turn-helix transcriptional regulator [Paenibacillus sp. 32352]|uniref:helix-turn-helix transcriptional regulator n=1 Tax=Paenibacillus sp. 32352 TaxID=1969111 RepID=UPI0009AEC410|nr:helix-turn-helix transcriptional regulator [Paenibacillus sp. 32352]